MVMDPQAHGLTGHPLVGQQVIVLIEKPGAGEANRTPDPNLGKVMLYP